MPSVRLDKWMRQRIIRDALNHKFNPIVQQIDKDERSLGDACWAEAYGEEGKRLSARKELYPWMLMRSTARVRFGTSWETVTFSCALPLKDRHENNTPILAVDIGSLLFNTWSELKERRRELQEQKRVAESMLQKLLGSVTTLRKLKEVWPEGAPFYAHLEAKAERERVQASQLPVDPGALNTMLGLPIPDAA